MIKYNILQIEFQGLHNNNNNNNNNNINNNASLLPPFADFI